MIDDKIRISATKEIHLLKKYATKTELSRLNIKNFDGRSGKQCFYGQLTGNAYSKRALELMNLCATESPVHFCLTNLESYAFARPTSKKDIGDIIHYLRNEGKDIVSLRHKTYYQNSPVRKHG